MKMQKSGCSLCKIENPLYKNIPSEKNLLLLNKPYLNGLTLSRGGVRVGSMGSIEPTDFDTLY